MDLTKFAIFGFLGPLFITWMDVKMMLEGDNKEFMWYLIWTYGLTIITFAYVTSFVFKSSSVA